MTATRGCGDRVAGGVYAEVHLSENGLPFDDFLIDAPTLSEAAIKSIGVQLVEVNNVWHVLDKVGKQHYETVPDFIEEARRFGISRRLPHTLDFSKITPASRLILAHDLAYIDGIAGLDLPHGHCYKNHDGHASRKTMCIYALYDVLPAGIRTMPSFSYESTGRGDENVTFKTAMFATFPISAIVQVRGGDDHSEKVGKAQIPFMFVDD